MFGGWGGAWGGAWGATGGSVGSVGGSHGSLASLLLTVKKGRKRKVEDQRSVDELVVAEITRGIAELEWPTSQTPVFVAPPSIDLVAVERLRKQAHEMEQEVVLRSITRILKAAQEADDKEVELLLLN